MDADEFPAQQLVRWVMDDRAILNAPKLADALGYPARNKEKGVGRWIAGETSPRYDPTLRLLSLAGLLDEDAIRARQLADEQAASGTTAQEEATAAEAAAAEATESIPERARRARPRRGRDTG